MACFFSILLPPLCHPGIQQIAGPMINYDNRSTIFLFCLVLPDLFFLCAARFAFSRKAEAT